MEGLDANSCRVLADLEGPGIIREIYYSDKIVRGIPGGPDRVTKSKLLTARGVVLEIWFDDAEQPAVMCPAADFFLMGCNNKGYRAGTSYAANYIVNNDRNQQCYFPMPFRKRARVIVRNDTPYDLLAYDYVEWEEVPELPDDLGYFHATYSRRCFQMTPETEITMLEISGSGHLVGRQFSYVTDERRYNNSSTLMEGNLEIDIDGRVRALDYLGTECPFNFGWGWRANLNGPRSGTPYQEAVDNSDDSFLYIMSTYRFYDHMPIRFQKSLRESVDWSHEQNFHKRMTDALEEGGGWVDIASVHYWYQQDPGGYKHQPLRPLEERAKMMLKKSLD